VIETVKQHPYASAAVGAGVGLILAEGARRAISAWSGGAPNGRAGRHDDGEGASSTGSSGARLAFESARQRAGEVTSRAGSLIRSGASSLGDSAQRGFQRGRETAAEAIDAYPLLVAASALAAGAVIGGMLPRTRTEDRLVGRLSDRFVGPLKRSARELIDSGKQLTARAISEAANTTAKEAEREGLSPDRLGRKVKRIASHVKEVVAEAMQEG